MTATKEKKRSVKLTKETRHGGTELTLSAGVLKAVLKVVGNAINTRVINPLYANVLFDGMNCITASNGEMRITAELGANGPAMLVPHERLSRIVAAVPSDAEVVMSTDGTQCKILCGHGKWLLPTSDPREYPKHTPEEFYPIAQLPGDQFVRLMRSVKDATDPNSARYVLDAVQLDYKAGTLYMIATDGKRMHVANAEINNACDDAKKLVPKNAVEVMLRIAGNSTASISLDANRSELMAQIGGTILTARLLDGQFPVWTKGLPDEQPGTTVGVAELLAVVEQGSICTSETSGGSEFIFVDSTLTVSTESSENGLSRARCDLIGSTKAIVKLNPAHVIQFLASLDTGDMVKIEQNGSSVGTVFRSGDRLAVILPMA